MEYVNILNDVCDLIIDCEHKTAPVQDEGYPSIRTPNIGRGKLILNGVNRVSEETYRLWTKRAIPQAGDLILAREAPAGNVAIIPSNLKVCLGQRTVLIRANKSKADSHYLLYLLLYDVTQARLLSYGSGATVPHVNMSDIRGLPLPEIPPLPTQRKIASILSAYDDLIENNTRRIKILEEMAQMVYREWFTYPFRGIPSPQPSPSGRGSRKAGEGAVRLVDSAMGKVPEGWEVKRLGEVCSLIKRGISPKYDDNSDQIVINQKCIRNFRLSLKEIRKHNSKVPAEKNVVQGDVLINSTGVGTLGRVAQVLQNIRDCTVDSHVTIVRRSAALDADFLGLQLFELQGHFESLGQGATGQTELGREAIAITDFLLAPRELQDKFATIVKPIRELTIKLLEKNDNLRQTRDLLLPKLISGEVDVEGMEIPLIDS